MSTPHPLASGLAELVILDDGVLGAGCGAGRSGRVVLREVTLGLLDQLDVELRHKCCTRHGLLPLFIGTFHVVT